MQQNNAKGTRYIITRGFGDMVCHLSLTRGCAYTSNPERAITFPSQAVAEAEMKAYAIRGAYVAPAL